MKKLFFLIGLLFLMIPLVTALTPPSGGVSYYNFSSLTDLWGSNDATSTGATSIASYPSFNISGNSSPSSFDFDGINDYISVSGTLTSSFKTFSIWFNSDNDITSSGAETLLVYDGSSVIKAIVFGGFTGNYDDEFLSFTYAGTQSYYWTFADIGTSSISAGTWNNVVVTWDSSSSNYRLYFNGVDIGVARKYGTPPEITTFADFRLGSRTDGSLPFDGKLDEVKIFNRILNTTEISNLYNYGNITRVTTASNFSVTVTDFWDGDPVNNINVTVDGVSYLNSTGNTITTHLLQNDSNLYDVYVATTSLSHFPKNYTNTDVSSNLVAELYATDIKFRGYTLDGDEIPINVTIEGVTKEQNESFYLDVDNNILAEATSTGYYPVNLTFNTTFQQNNTLSINGFYDVKLSVIPRSRLGNASFISNITFDGVLYQDVYNMTFNITQGEYPLIVKGVNYTSINSNVTINTSGAQTLYIYLFPYNSINFTFYDELNLSLIDYATITLELISDSFSYNYTTSNGTLLATLLYPEDYYIRYSASGYSSGNYYFTLNDDSANNLLLYMIPTGNSDNVTVNVFDTLSNAVVGANVKLLKYFVSTNSFLLVSAAETDFEGSVRFPIEKYTEYYKFIIEYNSETVLTTTPTYITGDEINLYVNLLDSGFDELFSLTGLYGKISYLNTTNTLRYVYSDADNLASGGCFYAYRTTVTGETLVNSSCGTGSANTIYMTVDNSSTAKYLIKGYITKGGVTSYLTNYLLSFDDYASDDNDGLILAIILLITFVFIGFWKLEVAVIMTGIGIFFISLLKIIVLPLTMAIPILVLSFVIAAIIGKVKQ